jgi:hypothetical protein
MQTMWQFTCGRFTVKAHIKPCDYLDLSWDDDGEIREGLESGALEAFDTRVSVWLNGAKIGEDWLSESIYADPADFFAEHRGPDPMHRNCSAMRAARGDSVVICHYFPSMVSEAIADARRWLAGAGMARAA